jgi:hypothetical protein
MKKILLIITVVAVAFAAVMGTMTLTANKSKSVPNADTVGLAQFQAWKAAQYDKMILEANQAEKQIAAKPAVRRTSTRSSSGSMNSVSSHPAKTTTEKKGWSKAAKGTVIGAGTGAVLGAVINKKNRAAGAVIGGILGGGLGYGIGRHMDKKDGRY